MNASTDAASAPGRTRSRLLAVAVVVLVGGALKLTQPVTLPLAFALFLMALFWPLQRRLAGRAGPGAAVLVTLTVCLVAVALFVGALWLCAREVIEKWPQYEPQFRRLARQARRGLQSRGLPVPGMLSGGEGGSAGSGGGGLAMALAERSFSLVGGFVLVIAFFALGLLEVRDFEAKLGRVVPGYAQGRWLAPLRRIVHDVQRYLGVRTLIGVIQGVVSGLVAWAVGLDFALVWGLSSFLLNYIPTLGSIIATVPPFLFALVQFEGIWMPIVVLLAMGGAQLVLGNYVDPLLQGKYLSLSPLVVLVSVVFWGWLWGIAGAFIGIPLTVAAVIACDRFEQTKWIATLLARRPEKDGARPTADGSDAPGSDDAPSSAANREKQQERASGTK